MNAHPTHYRRKPQKSELEQIQIFWKAPIDALFSDNTIAPVIGRSIKTLQCDRWRGKGIPYRKCGGRVLYRKSDVIAWLESHKLVSSTSEYRDQEAMA